MLQDLAIKLLVVVMMLAVGFDLPWSALREGLAKRTAMAVALLLNVVVVPLIVAGLAALLELDTGVAVGLTVAAVAPGGPTGPLFARIARADLGYATTLQVSLCFVALASAPASLELLSGAATEGDLLWPMTWTLAVYQLLPLSIGMLVRRHREAVALRLSKPTGLLANALLLLVIVGMLFARGHILFEQPPRLHLMVGSLVVGPLLLGMVWPGVRSTMMAAAFVTTVRNLSVALLLSSSFFEDPAVDAAVLVWGFYMMTLPTLLAALLGRRAERASPEARAGRALVD